MTNTTARVVWDGHQIARAIARMAHQIVEANAGGEGLMLLGIPTRGVLLARRLADQIRSIEGATVAVGELDITMYRDDLRSQPTRAVGRTAIPRSLDDQTVVLVDDVLFTGRSIAAALDALKEVGRPRTVQLAVLIDRGYRQLPIQADHVGRQLPVPAEARVNVRLTEIDDGDAVTISLTEA
ncbi:bifunctional pyr operon transcriptional regulator/uracil phosphoribosyltransferase PyrR [Micropruina sp.]|uniref:bifunctional pyr operon transcriptional regulator/uracil phosphoribosyltransferase PyrR n=1 Tax=Micropruina sp. TaxID=2737536 RepID=UPI0039E6A759